MKKIIVLALALTLLIALTSCFAHEHSYGEWRVVKEASTEDYGVRVKVCERCEEELYEAIPKIVPDVKFPASLFGEGSLIAVVFATITTVAVGVAVYFYVRLKKETESVQDDG
jgi:hypothetical protein